MTIEHTIIILLLLAILYQLFYNSAKESFARVNLDDNVLYRE